MTKKQELIFVYVFMNTIMCICMTVAGLLVNAGFITLPMFAITLLESLVICNLTTLLFRTPRLGSFLASKISGGPEKKSFGFWNGFVNASLNSIYMNTFMTLLNVGFRVEFFFAWAHSFLIMWLVSEVVSIVSSPIAIRIVKKCW